MLKSGIVLAAIAAIVASSPAAAGASTLMPGVTYTREVRWVGGDRVVLHILRAPRHGGLYGVRPVLSQGTVLGRATVPSMQHALSGRATVAGVNGDYFTLASGRPNGVFLRDGVLAARSFPQRSSLSVGFDGRLIVDRLRFFGSWRVGAFVAHPLEELNRPLVDPPGVALYTPRWGGRTPRYATAREVVLSGFPRALLNGYLTGTVAAVRRGGGTAIPVGGAVLQARGFWRNVLQREAPLGSEVIVRLRLPALSLDSADAIGGGPVLVRDGQAIYRSGEAFTRSQLAGNHPRTAVGQLADGRTILLVADGRSSASAGLTTWELALQMQRLGAVTAMGLDGGGSSTMAFNGRVLNRPSDGSARAVANGLFVFYYGVYAPPARRSVISPNGDGAADSQVLGAKLVRPSSVDVRLVRPNGTVAWRYRTSASSGWIRHPVGTSGMREGEWRWIAEAAETASGRTSRMTRRFTVNKTLGFLSLSKERMRVYPRRGGMLDVSVVLTRPAHVSVTVRNAAGVLKRTLFQGEAGAGTLAWRWNGRNASGAVVRTGTYTIRVKATNALGAVALSKRVRVIRVTA
ncbi:MAG: phosphodiester glycosidase family protein [Gaiellaceae bacterium]